MKISCINPETRTPKGIMIPQLSLHILYGLSPTEYSVKIIEEELEDINFDEECDLIGISCMTANAPSKATARGQVLFLADCPQKTFSPIPHKFPGISTIDLSVSRSDKCGRRGN